MSFEAEITARESRDWGYVADLIAEFRDQVTDDGGAGSLLDAAAMAGRPWLRCVEIWNGQRLGAFVLVDKGAGEAELHTLLKVGGRKALRAGQALLAWAFGAGGLQRITGRCPWTNQAILHYAKLNGFRVTGVRADWMKNGRRYVSTYVELTREESRKQHMANGRWQMAEQKAESRKQKAENRKDQVCQ